MAKLTGALLSMGATGTIGKTITFGKWKGIPYARQRVIPANPQTAAQQANRTRFAFLREMHKLAPAIVRAPWDAFADGRPFTGMNKFVGENNRLLVGEPDLANLLNSPGARGGLPPVAVTAVAGAQAGEVTVTVTPTDQLPEGWTVTAAHASAVVDQDPTGLFTGNYVAGTDAAAPYEITLAGFEAGQSLRAMGWVEYQKPDGKAAYSVSLNVAVNAA